MMGMADWTGEGEPALEDVLKDPIVRALMRRDSVAPRDLTSALRGRRSLDAEGASPDDAI